MSKDKIIKIPISFDERKRNSHPKGYVPCQVSGRYLQFNLENTSSDYVIANVMTENTEAGKDKKICELVLNVDDLKTLSALLS